MTNHIYMFVWIYMFISLVLIHWSEITKRFFQSDCIIWHAHKQQQYVTTESLHTTPHGYTPQGYCQSFSFQPLQQICGSNFMWYYQLAFLEGVLILSMFFCAYLPFTYPLWKSSCSKLLPVFFQKIELSIFGFQIKKLFICSNS